MKTRHVCRVQRTGPGLRGREGTTFMKQLILAIVVAVALDLVDRMNAQLLMRNYEGFMKGTPR